MVSRNSLGISYVMAAIMFTVIALALALFMIMSGLIPLTTTPTAISEALIQKAKLASNVFELQIQNPGQVEIKRIEIIAKSVDGKEVIKVDYKPNNSTKFIKQGQSYIVSCDRITKTCKSTITGIGEVDSTTKIDWNNIIAGKTYDLVIRVYFANGEIKTYTLRLTATYS